MAQMGAAFEGALPFANVEGDSFKAAARFVDRSGDGGGNERCGAMARYRGRDAIERARACFHHVMAAGAVDVHVHKAGHDSHAGGDVVDGAGGHANFVAMADGNDAAAIHEDYAVADFLEGREDAVSMNGGARHGVGRGGGREGYPEWGGKTHA